MDKMLIYAHASLISALGDEISRCVGEYEDMNNLVPPCVHRMLGDIMFRASEIADEVYFNDD